MTNNFLSRFLAVALLAVPSSVFASNLTSLAGYELPAVSSVPLPAAPEKAPRTCRPFLMAVSVGGVDETVVMSRVCTPENEAIWILQVELKGKTGISVKVASDKYPEQRARIEKRIMGMVVDGVSQENASFIVRQTGPSLKLAAKAEPAEKEKLLAEAAEALKNQLARP